MYFPYILKLTWLHDDVLNVYMARIRIFGGLGAIGRCRATELSDWAVRMMDGIV